MTGIFMASIIASFIRVSFWTAEGAVAELDFEGGARGGKGEIDRGTPLGLVNAGDGEEPGLIGDEELDCVDNDAVA